MDYIGFIAYLIAGELGILGHWWTRWSQDRTSNTFMEYLNDNKKYTVGAAVSIFTATATLYTAIQPPELSMQLLLLSYLAGDKLDSVVNKDSTTPTIGKKQELPVISKKSHEDISTVIAKSRHK